MSSLTLKFASQAKKMTEDLKQLATDIARESIGGNNSSYRRISELNRQIAALEVYMDEIEYRLTWRDLFCSQLRFAIMSVIAVVVGITLTHIFFLAH